MTIFDLIIPRFVTDDVAIKYLSDGDFEGVCLADEIRPGLCYDEIVTVKSFNLFGLGMFPVFFLP